MHIQRLLRISRPRFWIYELGPYLVGIAAALGTNHWSWIALPVIVFFIFFTYPANIYIYGINDAFDYETDKLNPKKIAYESLVMPDEHRKLFIHIFLVCIPFLIYALGIQLSLAAFLSLCVFFLCAGFYSAPPVRAKTKPFLDSFFSAGHYVATAVFAYLLGHDLLGTTPEILPLVLASIAGILWAMAMHAYSAIPDITADTDAGIATIATALGKKKTLLVCILCYLICGIIASSFIGVWSILVICIYTTLMLLSFKTNEQQLFKIYTYFPTINALAGMALFFFTLFS